MEFLKLYLIAFVVFLVIDILWLSVFAKKFYEKHLGYLMTKTPKYLAAALFYLVFIAGLVYFVIMPAVDAGEVTKAILSGLLFGFVTYATYDLTNLATVKDWPITITIVDLIWGSVLTTTISVATFYISSIFQ